MDIQTIATTALQAIAANGGFSLNPISGESNPTTGFMVSLKGHEKTYTSPTAADIEGYVREKLPALQTFRYTRFPNVFIGGWLNQGTTYMDLSVCVQDRGIAIALGRQNGQKAIYDCANQQDIVL